MRRLFILFILLITLYFKDGTEIAFHGFEYWMFETPKTVMVWWNTVCIGIISKDELTRWEADEVVRL